MPMIHDSVILSYVVDLQNDQIIIHTRYDDSRMVEETNIIFIDVLSHKFDHPLKGSIILSIQQSSVQHFMDDNSEMLLKSRSYGWPTWYESLEELQIILTEENYKYIELLSSYGMSGWVVAKDVQYVPRESMT
jgi:hypothetical protein